MFYLEDSNRHAKRIQQKDRHVKKQYSIAVKNKLSDRFKTQPHRLAKRSAMNCGNPKCICCMNPRKSFKELTYQELRFHQGANKDGLE